MREDEPITGHRGLSFCDASLESVEPARAEIKRTDTNRVVTKYEQKRSLVSVHARIQCV